MEYVKRQGAELSFIDRLVIQDQTPQNQYRTGIRRDLEDLLNTVVRARSIPNRLDDLNDSLINYGIVDLLTVNLTTQSDRDKIIEYIKHQIEKFEPRLFNIAIEDISNKDARSHTLSLKIVAETVIDNSQQEIIFNSRIDVSTGNIITNVLQK
jgi:type VI secretion system protein ImpF